MKISLQRRLAPLTLAATLFAGATLSAPSAMAQKATSPQSDLQTRTRNRVAEAFGTLGHRVESLHLSPAQKSKLVRIAQKSGPILPAMWKGSSLSGAQTKSQVSGVGREINAVFTSSQKQQIAAAKRESVGQLIGAAGWLSGELELTVKQQNQMQQIAMSAYQKGRVPARGAAKPVAIRDVVSDASTQFTRILTPPQKMKWSAIQRAASAEFSKQARLYQAMFSS